MRTIQLYGAGSSGATGVANVTIPTAGRIKGVQVSVGIDCVTDNSNLALELSLENASGISVNAAQGPFLDLRMASNFTTSGQSIVGINQFFPLDLEVKAGQQVFLHSAVGGTLAYTANFVIHYA